MAESQKKTSLKDQAYKIIKDRIVNCQYAPGVILNEAELADGLELSRTPLREAINKLESERFVSTIPKRGILVAPVTLNDVLQVFQTRVVTEPITLKMAAPYLEKTEVQRFYDKFQNTKEVLNSFRLDTAMHLFIIENCGNQYLIDMMHRVFEENTRIILSSKQNQLHIHDARQEHCEILRLILQDSLEEACNALRQHVESCRNAALDFFCNIQNKGTFNEKQELSYKNEIKLYEKSIH